MTLVHFGLACAILAIPGAALADTAAVPTAPAANTAPHERLICKSVEEMGSLIAKKKVCMTAADWKQKAYASGQWLEHQSVTHNGLQYH